MTVIEQVFIKILNMSLNATFVVIAVLFLRFFFRKIPKKYSYLLWMIVFLRFLWPFTVESVVSLIPVASEPITYERLASIMPNEEDGIDYGFDIANKDNTASHNNGVDISGEGDINGAENSQVGENFLLDNNYLLEEGINANTKATHRFDYIEIASIIWLTIVVFLLSVSIIKLSKLKVKLRTATFASVQFGKSSERIYETDQIVSPFIIGFVRPRIYLPIGLSDREKYHVIKHEQMHWKRKDYLVKLIAFFAAILHWFNPFVWLSYYLLIKDMEMSCDEMVMEQTNEDIRQDYSRSLLSLSIKQSGLLFPLAFGESNTKSRVKNVLNFRKPSSWVSIVAIILVVITAVTLLTNSKQVNVDESHKDEQQTSEDIMEEYTQRNALAEELYKNRTNYIGDNSKILALIGSLPIPEGLKYKSIELQTTTKPYELHVYYKYDLDNIVDTIDNDVEFKNAVLLFATIENMEKYTIHRTQDGGENRLSYTRSELEELFGDLYSYSESPEKLKRLMNIIDNYLDGIPVSVETAQYNGKPLTIGIIGEAPDIREEQVKFVTIQFSDLGDEKFQEQYDAIFITKDNLSEAAGDKYASIYKESIIPFFFIQSEKSHVPFINEGLSYEEVPDFENGSYVTGILQSINQGWGLGLYNDTWNSTNIKSVYSQIFETIEKTLDPKALAHVMSMDFRKLLAEKLQIDYDTKSINVVSGNIVTDNGISMTVGSTYNNGVVGTALLAFSKDNGEIFYNSMNPNLESIVLKLENDKELECLFTTELSEDNKILLCYLSYVNTADRTYDLVTFDIHNLINNQSQVEGVTFKDEIIYGNWSSTIALMDGDETIRAANTTLSKTVSMCGKELQIDNVILASNAVIFNTTVLKDEGIPTNMDALLSSVSTQSGAYYGVYVKLVYEDGTISDEIDCTLDDEGNIIAWLIEPIDMHSVKTVIVGDVSIDMKK